MPHCWKSHVAAQIRIARYTAITDHRTTHGTLNIKNIPFLNTNKKFAWLMSAENPYILRNVSKLLVALFSERGHPAINLRIVILGRTSNRTKVPTIVLT